MPPALVETAAYLAELYKCLFVCEQLAIDVLRVELGEAFVCLEPELQPDRAGVGDGPVRRLGPAGVRGAAHDGQIVRVAELVGLTSSSGYDRT